MNEDSVELYIGNLPWKLEEDDLYDLLAPYAPILGFRPLVDNRAHRFKGVCFVNLSPEAAERAVAELNGKSVMGRVMKVNFSKLMREIPQ